MGVGRALLKCSPCSVVGLAECRLVWGSLSATVGSCLLPKHQVPSSYLHFVVNKKQAKALVGEIMATISDGETSKQNKQYMRLGGKYS